MMTNLANLANLNTALSRYDALGLDANPARADNFNVEETDAARRVAEAARLLADYLNREADQGHPTTHGQIGYSLADTGDAEINLLQLLASIGTTVDLDARERISDWWIARVDADRRDEQIGLRPRTL